MRDGDPAPDRWRQPSGPAQQIAARAAAWLRGTVAVASDDIAGAALPCEPSPLLACARERRRAERASGRACALAALGRLGAAAAGIPAGRLGEPLWPAGFTGSISHDGDVAIAVVAPTDAWCALGIDIVAPGREWLPEASSLLLAHGERVPALDRAADRDGTIDVSAELVLFSIKEAAVKALSPRLDRRIDFTELGTRLCGDRFHARLERSAGVAVGGRWALVGGFVLAVAAMAPDANGARA
jgi:4'-phosphopantetheinyl transferase EntD